MAAKHTVTLYAELYRPLMDRMYRMGLQPGSFRGRWRSFQSGYPGVVYAVGHTEGGYPCVFLQLLGPDRQDRYQALVLHRQAIDHQLPGAMWGEAPDDYWHGCIALQNGVPFSLEAPEAEQEAMRRWLADNLIRLRHVLQPYLMLPLE